MCTSTVSSNLATDVFLTTSLERALVKGSARLLKDLTYIMEIIVRYIKKCSNSNKKTKYEDGKKDYGKESNM